MFLGEFRRREPHAEILLDEEQQLHDRHRVQARVKEV